MESFYIPVDSKVLAFRDHLKANTRTILSAKFGDGKSFFLKKVKEDSRVQKDFQFITLYPVNYQVAENKDIFELIKRDILFQLLVNEMVSDRIVFTQKEILAWYILNSKVNILLDIVQYMPTLGFDEDTKAKLSAAIASLKLFKTLKCKYDKYTRKYLTDEELETAFFKKVEKHYILECDPITSLIQRIIKDYKNRTGKEVVLLIEDLDRIDPKHLFRILNIFSAHMDYGYKQNTPIDETLVGNKFGVDKVVIVLDYDNLKKIYHHFYGTNVDISGYISKFLSSRCFSYSLRDVKREYVVNYLIEQTGLPKKTLESALDDKDNIPGENYYTASSLRDLVHSFEISKQICRKPVAIAKGKSIHIDIRMLKLMAFLRRLGFDDRYITSFVRDLEYDDRDTFITYVCPFAFVRDTPKNLTMQISISCDRHEYCQGELKLQQDGTAVFYGPYVAESSSSSLFDMIVSMMLEYFAP